MSDEKPTEVKAATKKVAKKAGKKATAKKVAAKTAKKAVGFDLSQTDWRKKIPAEHYGLQEFYLREKGIEPEKLTSEELDELKEAAPDEVLYVTLAGLRDLATKRGIKRVSEQVLECTDERSVIKCSIEFYENDIDGVHYPPQEFSGVANATGKNTDFPFDMFKEALASNRAFARACRQAFNIAVVSQDELEVRRSTPSGPSILGGDADEVEKTAQETLENLVAAKGKTFTDFKGNLLTKDDWKERAASWNNFSDVPSPEAVELVSLIIEPK